MTPFGSALFYACAKLMDLQPQAVVPTIQVGPLWIVMLEHVQYRYMHTFCHAAMTFESEAHATNSKRCSTSESDNGWSLQEKLLPTMRNSLKLWPLAHAVNFAFIPSQQRLLYINVISVSLKTFCFVTTCCIHTCSNDTMPGMGQCEIST